MCALCHGRHGAAHPGETKCFGSSVAGKNLKCINTAFTCLKQQKRAQPLFFYFKNAFHLLAVGFFLGFGFFSDWTLNFAGLGERSFCPAVQG